MNIYPNVFPISLDCPDPDLIQRAAALLRSGQLVAFPTETVYGLGANALDSVAVARIFESKGRPSTNPIIAHVHCAEAAKQLVTSWPETAQKIADAFWPGPVTIVLPRRKLVPDIVTAGGDTVAVRVPQHPVALALLQAAGIPIAAPSANKSTRISPVRASHVAHYFSPDEVPMILDGGLTKRGIESVVVDLTVDVPRILRPGVIPPEEIARVLGCDVALGHAGTLPRNGTPARSPGLMTRHYAPLTPLVLAPKDSVHALIEQLTRQGKRVYYMALQSTPNQAATLLYETLHRIDDEQHFDVIVADEPPATQEWAGVADRMRRAATR